MIDHAAKKALPPLPGLIAGSLVVAGVLLWMFVSKGLLIVAGLGAFGPGILRELGWLQDHDEFQRQAAHKAGYHAYLIGGLATVIILSALQWKEQLVGDPSEWITLILVILWLSWLFSALLAYWGAPKTTSRVLATFGSFWALFVLATLIGEASNPGESGDFWQGMLGVLAGVAVVVPFFALAWSVRRWPRLTGGALLIVAVLFFVLFGFPTGSGNLSLSTELLTTTLLIVPLIACGMALLHEITPQDSIEDEI